MEQASTGSASKKRANPLRASPQLTLTLPPMTTHRQSVASLSHRRSFALLPARIGLPDVACLLMTFASANSQGFGRSIPPDPRHPRPEAMAPPQPNARAAYGPVWVRRGVSCVPSGHRLFR